MDFVVRYRVRRHLSASAPRGQGKGAAGIAADTSCHAKKQDPLGSCFRISRCRATSIVAAVEAVMMVVVVMMVTVPAVAGRHDNDTRRVSAVGVMMMVM